MTKRAENTFELLTDRGPAAIAVVRLAGPGAADFLTRHVRAFGAPGAAWGSGDVRPARFIDERSEVLDDIIVSIHANPPRVEARLHTHGGRGVVDALLRLAAGAGFEVIADGAAGAGQGTTPPTRGPARIAVEGTVEAGPGATDCKPAPPMAGDKLGPPPTGRESAPSSAGCTPPPPLWHTDEPLERVAYGLLPRMTTLAGAKWLLHQARVFPAALRTLLARRRAGENETVLSETRELATRYRIFEWFSAPARVALIGPPNAGKSTLLNVLTDRPTSIVSDTAGTTRDWVEAPGEVGGYPVTWIDTAGLRHAPGDDLEREGVRRSLAVSASANAIVALLDGSDTDVEHVRQFLDIAEIITPHLVVLNKSDLAEPLSAVTDAFRTRWNAPIIRISATSRAGLPDLQAALLCALGRAGVDLTAAAPFIPLSEFVDGGAQLTE